MDVKLSPRSRQILEAIVEDYIATAEPVGSSAVARRHAAGLDRGAHAPILSWP